ncbi:NtaA/DmoA family FMN-dependent monooxygenase [Peribacillus simplex]|uniref:NtaA/DmoA family FMN-dependent monooxygenase n=2 Tax=Peribacillus TaxID=2675229 RepID=A0AA90T971_9BACI|nr:MULTISPECIES: NtaA/DmoA family FMN-dependent monooxygenase [Peribacillus]MDP1421989.1 NtaA/DmoA family FMN-dependent monooxygenase [Peribacillus simplex]MDP1454662.1 NtaA/DmoA family FMN-dependent monooxygenase [Peribacillus frigoritolerans]
MIERKLKLGGIIDGVGWSYFGWRHPDIPANASENIDFYVEKAIQLENAKFDAIFLADVSHIGPGMIPHYLSMFEGISILSALSMVTHSIGLTATIATSYADPFTVARQIASLDKISNGRAGWNAITSNPGGLANYSRTHLRKSDLYPLKEEFLEIVEGLWDSYEDDAFIRDKKSGVFYDPSKMHSLNYTGNYFSVDGPLNISRSRQGRPVVFQAGTSSAFMDIAAKYAEVIMAPGDNFDYLKGFTAELKRRVENQGRSPNDLLIMPSHSPIVGKTEKDALEKLREIESLMPIGHRLPRPQLMGSAENVAEKIEHWYREGVMDILLIRQDYPAGFEDFIKLVVPILQEKGIFKKEYEANTLRGNLELPYPETMYKE